MYERTFSGALGPYFSQIKQIVAGGNGRILSGIDTRFDFPVCIKRISVANKDECRAALREIRIRRRLRHENIVGLLNAIISDGTDVSEISPANFRETSCIYFVQELLDADLRQVIESHTRLSDEYVKLFFYQLLRGLKYIHSANVLHRDLKPSNIMVNVNSLQLMVGDFGHSMVLDPEYNHGPALTACDTSLWYKAPQLILGTGQYSTASDMWAVGCILAEMLLGRPLFEGENDLEQLELIIHAIKVPIKDQSHIRTYLTDKVNIMYSGEPKFPLQSKFQKVDCQAFHLLERLLSFSPDDRVTAELALSHPFLHEYACVADEPVCLKPLHLEHEVDDFLEYTVKDLIVGECVALAEEQPRIHQQMSSYSSLTDIAKEFSVSPSESASHSTDERCSLDLRTVGEDYHENSNGNECNRFKVLEVLKEEHGSSSDSNGLAAHDEGVSEAPLVLDHPMFSSSKWEERQRSGHRRHHHHRRKKKFHLKSPGSENEPSLDSNGARFHEHSNGSKEERLSEVQVPISEIPENHVPGSSGPDVQRCVVSPAGHPPNPQTSLVQQSTEVPLITNSLTQAADDKVHELIMRSRQIIAEQIVDSVPAICDICGSLPPTTTSSDISNNIPPVPTAVCVAEPCNEISIKFGDEKVLDKDISSSVGNLSLSSNCNPTLDLGVAEVIRKSQELLGDAYKSNVGEERSLMPDDRVQDLILRSEQLLKNKVELETLNPSRHDSFPPGEKGSLPGVGSDSFNSSFQPLPSLRETSDEFQATRGSTGLNIEHSIPKPTLDHYNYPRPFTERPLNSTAHLPPFNHHIDSSTGEKVDIPSTITSNSPYLATDNSTFQPMHNNQDLPKETDRRMRYLLQECNQILSPMDEPKPKNKDQLGVTPCVEKSQKNEGSSQMNDIQRFRDQSLDSIDRQEIKSVLDQARKLLEKSNELSSRNDNVFLDYDQSVMEVDENTGLDRNAGKLSRMDVDESSDVKNCAGSLESDPERAVEGSLKKLPCFQNKLDFVDEVSEQTPVSDRDVKFGDVRVKSIDDTFANATESHRDFNQSTFEGNHHFHNRSLDEAAVQKRSNETVDDDNTHKHLKNSNMTSPDVYFSIATVCDSKAGSESKNHSPEDDKKQFRLNGISTNILDLNVDKRLTADSKYKLNLNQMECRKYSSKYDSLARNKNAFSNRMSDEVVDKLCGNTCRIENGTRRLNSKDSNRLQSFYEALKIKSIMRNRTGPIRDKRHDTYPF